MQCKFLVALVVSCLALTISAAPIIEQAARAPLKEEAREPGCSLYTCICLLYTRSPTKTSPRALIITIQLVDPAHLSPLLVLF
ncbi:hypothetical protein C8J57DRAFT_1703496 [Mycena rebaudengoi]|nr:hypothetical protein C8J57DRAFT_1703496 [Mycena rebaudengoi]